MITLKKFYIDGELADGSTFEPITFDKGINLILGDRSSESAEKSQQEKMNSVGKSLLVEMINYCLLKDSAHSRVEKIPFDVLPTEAYLCLEMEYENENTIQKICVRRSRYDKQPIEISVDGEAAEFDNNELDKAIEYLGRYFLSTTLEETPTLRQLLSIIIRDEKTGFDDILYPNARMRTSDYAKVILPHAYLFRLSVETIKTISKTNKAIEKVRTVSGDMQKRISIEGVKLSEVRLYINDLDREVQKLDVATQAMKPSEGAQKLLDELNQLNENLEDLVSKKSSKETLSRKIKSMPVQNEQIKPNEISAIYDKYKAGLGDLVSRTFEETLAFRSQISEFENELMTDKILKLNGEIADLSREIDKLDDRIAKIYDAIGYTDRVTDFRVALKQQTESQDKLGRLKQHYKVYEEKEAEKKQLVKERGELVGQIETKLFDIQKQLDDFENDLIAIHEAVYDNAACQFKIDINQKAPKQYLVFNYRTYLDGGASSDRTKIFMYDVLLMLNTYTAERHPGFLIHDNVFAAVGKNDMVNSLNYLNDQFNKGKKFQYIVAINRDEFEAQESQLNFKTEDKKRAVLTRENQLLRKKYAEL